jgi:NAD(P)-dependent dehydrogenase (short-subunit alcohol dehydrogenase family)
VAHLEPFLETKVENWDHTMNVNVRAAFISMIFSDESTNISNTVILSFLFHVLSFSKTVSQVIARQLITRKVPGAIVNISSQASMVSFPFFSFVHIF